MHFGVGLAADKDEVGVLAVGDVGFAAIDDIMIAIPFGGRSNALKVRTNTGLRHGNRGDRFTRNKSRQPLPFLLFAAVGYQVIDDDVGLQRKTERGSPIGNLFVDYRIVAKIETEPAILFRHRRTKHANCACFGPDLLFNNPGCVPSLDMGNDFRLDKTANRLTKRFMILVIRCASSHIERHISPSCFTFA